MEPIAKISNLIQSLQLPVLEHDLDSIPIERDSFESYHKLLENHLPVLFDYVQQEPKILKLCCETNDINYQETQVRLICLLCEISSPDSIFQLNHPELIQNADRILNNLRNISHELDDLMFKYYEDKLHKALWKKQIGAVHGFVKYLEFRFANVCNLNQRMDQKLLRFCLSVALNIRSCFETHYKTLSTSIFIIMLQNGNKEEIIFMNIHGVIYDAVFKDVNKTDSTYFINKQWNCLMRCLDFFDNFDSFTWNFLDDMMEVLLRNLTLSSNSVTSICFLKFVSKLTVYYTIDHKNFEEFYDMDLSLVENQKNFRLLAHSNTSYTCYRWAKSILDMFVLESYKLMQTKDAGKIMLQEMHKIYILAILPIRISIIEEHLVTFFDKFIAVLMETLKTYKTQEDIAMLITAILGTFYFQLQNSEESIKLNNFKQNIYLLLKTKDFKKYVTI